MKKTKNTRRMFFAFFSLLIVQICLINSIVYVCKEYTTNSANLEETRVQNEEILISDTIRGQQRYMLSSIKQSWIKYLELYGDNLLAKDNEGHPIYKNEESHIGFNNEIMYKVQKESNNFDIYNREDDSLLIENAKPKWNSEEVEKILSLFVAPVKSFGNNGGVIAFDSYSGEIFLDTTNINRKGSIFEDHLNKLNKNPEETLLAINNHMVIKKDSDRSTEFVYLFNEETIMGEDAENFKLYPLGKYKRQFIEKLILPYETFGFDGQPMQLTIMLIADEQDIYKAYKSNIENFDDALIINEELYAKTTIILIISTLIIMMTMLLAVYTLKYVPNKKDE